MISDKVIFQYGNANEPNYIFYKNKFEGQLANGVKLQRSESALSDGSQRLNGANRNKRADYLFEYSFSNPFTSIFTTDFVNRVFFGPPRLTFWYQVKQLSEDRNYIRPPEKWFYNIADCTIPPTIKEGQFENKTMADQDYTVALTLEKPYLYDCSADIEYVDLANYISGLTVWGSFLYLAAAWGSSFAPVNINTITDAQKQAFFTSLGVENINYFVYLRDRFFERDVTQTNRMYVLNNMLSASATNDYLLSDVTSGGNTYSFKDSPAENQIYRLEISQLTIGKSVTLQNLNNGSGIRIKWLDSVNSPTNLVYNSYYNRLYSGSLEVEVATSRYNVEAVGSRGLYFSGLLNPRPFETITNETIRVTNNGTGSVTVKIDNLFTY